MVDPTNGPDAQSPWSHIWRRALRLLLPRQAGPAGCRDCGIPHRRGAADQPRRPQAEPLRRDRCRLRQISRYPLRYERQYRPEYLKYPEYLLAFSVLLLTPTFAAAANQDASPAPTDCPATSVEENIALVEEAQAAVASADADAIDRILADTYTCNQNRYGLPDDPTSNIAQYPRRGLALLVGLGVYEPLPTMEATPAAQELRYANQHSIQAGGAQSTGLNLRCPLRSPVGSPCQFAALISRLTPWRFGEGSPARICNSTNMQYGADRPGTKGTRTSSMHRGFRVAPHAQGGTGRGVLCPVVMPLPIGTDIEPAFRREV